MNLLWIIFLQVIKVILGMFAKVKLFNLMNSYSELFFLQVIKLAHKPGTPKINKL